MSDLFKTTMLEHKSPLDDSQSLFDVLDAWVEIGWINRLDRACARFVQQLAPDSKPLAQLTASLVSHQAGSGHLCLDLTACLENANFFLRMPPPDQTTASNDQPITPAKLLDGVDTARWIEALKQSGLFTDAQNASPWVLDLSENDTQARVYLRRFWHIEQQLATHIAVRLAAAQRPPIEPLRSLLAQLFPDAIAKRADGQKLACATAMANQFTVITGGPGTGKTTTVVRLLVLLQALASDGQSLNIVLCAPTGKAAARLEQSIHAARAKLAELDDRSGTLGDRCWADIAERIPTQAQTIHRLIGLRPQQGARHHAQNPLIADVVVVDEASMVGVGLMAQLLDALPASTKVILLGDKDQLASVEPGALLGGLCEQAQRGASSPEINQWLSKVAELPTPAGAQGSLFAGSGLTELDDAIAVLDQSHRFNQQSAIGRLATAINQGQSQQALALLRNSRDTDVSVEWVNNDDNSAMQAFITQWKQHLNPWLELIKPMQDQGINPDDPADCQQLCNLFEQIRQFQLLCAVRRGPSGTETLNALLEAQLNATTAANFPGRLIIVTRNDPQLGLANGDIGVVVPVVQEDANPQQTVLKIAFEADNDAGVRLIHPSRLHHYQSAFALTVHKAQGSEFAHTALALPDRANPILSRELLYTAVTRARERFSLAIIGPQASRNSTEVVLRYSINTITRRDGNLINRIERALAELRPCD